MEQKKILFISYFYPPYNSVGVKRVAYWANNIETFGFTPLVFTAIEQEKTANLKHIPVNEKGGILRKIIKDEGLNWIENLKKELRNYKPNTFDFILISGGPFMHMLITKFLRTHFDAKIILDFRDPFYANPRFQSSKIKDIVKAYYQRKFLNYTDLVITVNEVCKKLIKHPNIEIIDNGYDEKALELLEINTENISHNIFNTLAIGRVYDDFNIEPFFNTIKLLPEVNFNYIGSHKFNKYEGEYHHGGFVPYSESLQYIAKTDLCILFTGGMPFESSTKVFDFLGLNKKILIITQGIPKSGSLHEITKDYPNVFWSVNNTDSIKHVFEEIKRHDLITQDTTRFSRAGGLKKLTEILAK